MQNERNKKNIVQDVVPPKKSIRSVELPSRRRIPAEPTRKISVNKPSLKKDEPLPKVEPKSQQYSYEYDEPVKKSKKGIYLSLGILILVLAFGISALFKNAKITVTPQNQTISLNSEFLAQKDDTSKNLGFQIVTISKDLEKTVPSTGEKKVEKKATGKIVIFNNYSSTPQKLIATTRFQTPEGLVFRLISAVTVPGQQTKNGKLVAGSIEATVEADVAGDSYNIGLKDFVLPALKGTPRYSQMYARSKTVMAGGFSGIQKSVSDDVLAATDIELESKLKEALSADIVSQIPANFVLYKNGLSYTLSSASVIGSNESGAIVRKKGTAYAIIFDKGVLSRVIISKLLPNSANDVIKITNLDKLTFSYVDGKAFNPVVGDTVLNFKLLGDVKFVWVFDENKLKTDILGLSKKQAREVIGKYGSITEIWLETSPFWNQTIPNDSKKVKIINTMAD